MKSKEIKDLTGCKQKYLLQQKHLSHENQSLVFGKAILEMARMLENHIPPKEVCENIKKYLKEHYKEEWFPLPWQCQEAARYDVQAFERFLLWFDYMDKDIISNQTFSIPHVFTIQDMEVKNIEGMANLIIRRPNRVDGYIIKRKFPKEFSYQARKNENKIYASTELQYLLHHLQKGYGEETELYVHMVRLIGKPDTATELKEFEKKRGDHVISFSYAEYQKKRGDNILKNIEEDVRQESRLQCENCFYYQLCHYNMVYKAAEDENKLSKKTMTFTENQKQVITDYQGYMRVAAGPGSGKTATLVARVAYMLSQGIKEEDIVAITFTKKAAREMAMRIKAEGIYISTIHSLALDLLRTYSTIPIHLISKIDQYQMLLELLKMGPLIEKVSYQGIFLEHGLLANLLKDFAFIDKNGEEAFIKANQKKDWKNILKLKKTYEQIVNSNGYRTYEDLIVIAVDYLKQYPFIRNRIHKRFPYLLVDEVQDIDPKQAELIKLLAGKHLLVCGDPDQSIYGFRGASNSFLLHFETEFPQAKLVTLTDNFRSTKEIVQAAQTLIEQNQERLPMEFTAHRNGPKGIHIKHFQKKQFGSFLESLVAQGYQYGDIAILARTNKTLHQIEQELSLAKHLPVEKPKYYVKDDFVFLSLLHLLSLYDSKMQDDRAFFWFLSHYQIDRGKSDPTESYYNNFIHDNLIFDFYDTEASRYMEAQTDPLLKLMANIYQCFLYFNNFAIVEALDKIGPFLFAEKLDYEIVILQLKDLIKERKIDTIPDFFHYLQRMVWFQSDARVEYNLKLSNRIHLLTAHDAKGLEFPVVIVYGVEEFEKEGTEEERRLFYVALTRAEKQFFTIEIEPGKSTFIKEMGDAIDWK